MLSLEFLARFIGLLMPEVKLAPRAFKIWSAVGDPIAIWVGTLTPLQIAVYVITLFTLVWLVSYLLVSKLLEERARGWGWRLIKISASLLLGYAGFSFLLLR